MASSNPNPNLKLASRVVVGPRLDIGSMVKSSSGGTCSQGVAVMMNPFRTASTTFNFTLSGVLAVDLVTQLN